MVNSKRKKEKTGKDKGKGVPSFMKLDSTGGTAINNINVRSEFADAELCT